MPKLALTLGDAAALGEDTSPRVGDTLGDTPLGLTDADTDGEPPPLAGDGDTAGETPPGLALGETDGVLDAPPPPAALGDTEGVGPTALALALELDDAVMLALVLGLSDVDCARADSASAEHSSASAPPRDALPRERGAGDMAPTRAAAKLARCLRTRAARH